MPSGRFEHIEIPAGDPEAAGKFYETVFGWSLVRDMPGYLMFRAGPQDGGAFLQRPAAQKGVGIVPYVTVASIAETLAKVERAGGKTVEGRSAIVEGKSWWALFADPHGNEIGLYEGTS